MTPDLHLLIYFLILNAVGIWGFHIATEVDFLDDEYPDHGIVKDSKMILWWVKYWSVKKLGWFWSKPICTCPACMSSIHSTYFYAFFLYLVNFQTIWIAFYPMYILILAGINYFIGLVIEKLKK
jgi:hypothetical protein